jgi:hypothetical protein
MKENEHEDVSGRFSDSNDGRPAPCGLAPTTLYSIDMRYVPSKPIAVGERPAGTGWWPWRLSATPDLPEIPCASER